MSGKNHGQIMAAPILPSRENIPPFQSVTKSMVRNNPSQRQDLQAETKKAQKSAS
jgi:hypothetical protein